MRRSYTTRRPAILLSILLVSCTDRVVVPLTVDDVQVSPTSLTLEVGEPRALRATPRGRGHDLEDRPVSWSVDNEGLVQLASDGTVTGVAPGTTRIVATSEGSSGEAMVTVVAAAVAAIDLTPSPDPLYPGSSLQLAATVRDARAAPLTGRTVTWSSSDESIATVDENGIATGVSVGEARITASSEGKSSHVDLTVEAEPVASISLAPSPAVVMDGETLQLTATLRTSRGGVITRVVAWSSGDQQIATVSPAGLVTAVRPGVVKITASSEGKSAELEVTVTLAAVGSVELRPLSGPIEVGERRQLEVVVRSTTGSILTGRTVSWSYTTGRVVVAPNGMVRGLSVGTATVTAETGGKTSPPIQVQVLARLEIAFTRDVGNREIYAISTDGSREVRLTDHAGDDYSPRWSPDGQRIAFLSIRSGGRPALHVMRTDGTGLIQVSPATTAVASFSWMGQSGDRLVFANDGQIFAVDADGSDLRQLTTSAQRSFDPSPSPDGSEVVFMRASASPDNPFTLRVINADGTGERPITDGTLSALTPVWSTDGNLIAFTGPAVNSQIHVVTPNGTDLRALTSNGAMNFNPRWSPDSRRILFLQNTLSTRTMRLINPDGTGGRALPRVGPRQFSASWSPDGERIAYAEGTSTLADVFIIQADGTGRTQVTDTSFPELEVDWRP